MNKYAEYSLPENECTLKKISKTIIFSCVKPTEQYANCI